MLSWVVLHRPRDAADLLGVEALVSLGAVIRAKWSFFNYYGIPVVLLRAGFAFEERLVGPSPDWLLPEPRWCLVGKTLVSHRQAASLSSWRRYR